LDLFAWGGGDSLREHDGPEQSPEAEGIPSLERIPAMSDVKQEHVTGFPPPLILDNAGDVGEGIIESYSEGPNRFNPGTNTPICNILLDDIGQVRSLWIARFVLRSKFAELKPKVGERVRVEYLGMREGGNGNNYHHYSVTCPDRPAFTPDWSELGDGDESWG
jgi:hypothetical protein